MRANLDRHPLPGDIRAKMKQGKLVSPEEAVEIIQSNDVIALGGFIGIGVAEELLQALERRFLATGEPKNLTIIYASGIGDGKTKGVNHIAHKGLIKRAICGHWGMTPQLAKLAFDNEIEAYNLPQGVISSLFRDSAAHKPRTITSVGLGTFVDPRINGGKLNDITKEDLVELVSFDGKEYLAYKTFNIDVAIIRATTADLDGNLTMEKEALTLDNLSISMAAKNSNGFVLAQVERICDSGALATRQVKIPGLLIDCVAVAKPENHMQTWNTLYNPAFAGEYRVPLSTIPVIPLDDKKVMARRAAFELMPNGVVNLGLGIPENLASVAAEEGIFDLLTLTAEPGVIGGIPSGALDFGTATNASAIIDQSYQFDFYDGGGLDISFLGLAQADQFGNLNVSKFGPRLAGAGGFINISQNAKKIVFMGTFTADGIKVAVNDGKLNIIQEGKVKKLIKQVEQITFSGKVAAASDQYVLYITERAVFKLTRQGMELIEIAPGIDLEKDIIAQMEFKPVISPNLKVMDAKIFTDEPMGIKTDLLAIPIAERLIYNSDDNLFFVNFENLNVRNKDDVDEIREQVEKILKPINCKVKAIVNYDRFDIVPEMIDYYMEMVRYLVENYYEQVNRYSTSAFMRLKLGDTLSERDLSPYIYESRSEASRALKPK